MNTKSNKIESIWPNTSAESAIMLPDGSEFSTWEEPCTFSRTWIVNQKHPAADDSNPGTEDKPLLTISAAAGQAQPGERVLIKGGVYRECVRPARGGLGPDRMISFEAAENEEVIVDGAEVIESGWRKSEGWRGPRNRDVDDVPVWTVRMPRSWFVGSNPFTVLNKIVAASGGGYDVTKVDRIEIYFLRRGMVFQNGRFMKQVSNYSELFDSPGAFFPDPTGLVLHVRPFGDADPNQCLFDATAREQWFCPDEAGFGYIRIKGINFRYAGNGFPFVPQDGAVSANRGHHWIIEDCHFSWANGIGVELGRRDARMDWAEVHGHHIVRRNTVTDCGICGMASLGLLNSLVEDNLIERCCWHNVERQYESAGIKFHHVHNSLIRRNVIRNTQYGAGVWLDFDNINSRFTQNVIINTTTRFGGLFLEASHEANMVDNNIIWNAKPNDGSGGNGIYCHDTDRLQASHNLIVDCEGYGICLPQGQPDRYIGGRGSTSRKHVIRNNVMVDNARHIQLANTDSICDSNCYAGSTQPGPFLISDLREHLDLRTWKEFHGFDLGSTEPIITANLDAESLIMNWSLEGHLPECKPVPGVSYYPTPDAQRTCPGPFAALPEGAVIVDPRHVEK
ncbi:right-handed parallel beta-helix repeat-containing protein [Candidatus Poribacteria bacterium]